MTEHRRDPRLRKRLRVIMSDQGRERVGFTSNLSRTGLCVNSSAVFPPGSKIQGRLALPSGDEVRFMAEVKWARQVRAGLTLQAQSAMGIRFVGAMTGTYETFLMEALKTHAFMLMGAPVHGAAAAAAGAIGDPAPAPSSVAGRGAGGSGSPKSAKTGGGAAASGTGPPRSNLTDMMVAAEMTPPPFPPESTVPEREGRLTVAVALDDLAASDVYGGSLSLARATQWIDQAAQKAVAPLLASGTTSVGASMRLTIAHVPPTALGSKLVVIARLIEMGPAAKTLTFAVSIRDDGREIAAGKHMRIVLDPKIGSGSRTKRE